MSKVLSVTEVRTNLLALVEEVAQAEEEVIITTHNQPMAVLMGHRAFQDWQAGRRAQARAQLDTGIARALELIAAAETACRREGEGELFLLLVNLEPILKELWEAAGDISEQHAALVALLLDVTQILLEGQEALRPEQLLPLSRTLERLKAGPLTPRDVAWANQQFADVGLRTLFPVPGDLAGLYESEGPTA